MYLIDYSMKNMPLDDKIRIKKCITYIEMSTVLRMHILFVISL